MEEYQESIIQIITNAGIAKSKAMEAVLLAQKGDAQTATIRLGEGKTELVKAHKGQTRLIQEEADGVSQPVTLLTVHAQDHLMSAMVIRDLAEHIVQLYDRLARCEETLHISSTQEEK